MSNTRYLNSTAVYDGNFYIAKIGGVVDKHLGDTMDTLSITIREDAGIEFKRFKQIQIDATIWIIVDVNENVLVNNSDGTARYVDYELILSSPEIILQRKMTSAFSISQPIDGSDKTSLYEELNRLRYKVDGKKYDYGISDNLESLTKNVDCAEITLERSNLYDVMNVLLSQINCVVTATINASDYITIDAKKLDAGDDATLSGLNSFAVKKSGSDYANALNLKIEQGINVNSEKLTKSEFGLTVRTRDDFAVTDNNCEIILQNNIYGISHMYLLIPKLDFQINYMDRDGNAVKNIVLYNVKLDVAEKHLLEKKAFDLKDPIESSWNIGDGIDPDNQNYYIYYELGDNRIQGFGNTWNYFLGFNGMVFTSIIEEMVKELEETYYEDYMLSPTIAYTNYSSKFDNDSYEIFDDYEVFTDFTSNYKNWAFDIEYQAESKYKLQFGKTIQNGDEEIALFDKQNEAYVNIEKYGDSEQIKADRTGNPVKRVRGKVARVEDLMELGEKDNEWVVSRIQYSIYPDFVNYYYEMNYKYTINNLFNAIAQKKRITQISTDYFDREILVKYKIKFSTDPDEEYITPPTNRIIKALYGSFIDSDNNDDAIAALYLDCRDASNNRLVTYLTERGSAWMQSTKAVMGNTLALHVQCETNSYVGRARENTSSYSNSGAGQNKVKYVDDNGEVYKFCLRCKNKAELEAFESGNYGHIFTFNQYPYWGDTEAQLIDYEIIYKSQNERLGITLQFECCVSEDITPINIPYLAERIIVEPNTSVGAGINIIGSRGAVEPDSIGIANNGKIIIATTEEPVESTGKYYLVIDGKIVFSWENAQLIYVCIQR